jgi:hypothetical protein
MDELADPEAAPPRVVRIGAPARLAGSEVIGGELRYAAHQLLAAGEASLAVISGEPLAPDAAPGPSVSDRALALDDPRGLARARAPFVDVRPGIAALVLGFGPASGGAAAGELLAVTGPVLDSGDAAELAIAARAAPGLLGGGVFDDAGRLVGVAARALDDPGGGGPQVRAVRATAIAARLRAALRAAPEALRMRAAAFLP